uniref:DUF4939 domain-containing protein n=1 Tax=Monopterus albus TaxID=43700 RepID=A0A3Q3IA62_MONAL
PYHQLHLIRLLTILPGFTPHPRRDPHIPEPDTFDGNVESCRGFLLQCRWVFDHQPQTYITDREKISYIINRLRGKALLWAEAADSQGLFIETRQCVEEAICTAS